MRFPWRHGVLAACGAALLLGPMRGVAQPLPGAGELAAGVDRSEEMRAGIERFLDAATARVTAERAARPPRAAASEAEYRAALPAPRERLAALLGVARDEGRTPELRLEATPARAAEIARSAGCRVEVVGWSYGPGLEAEGLLLTPTGPIRARVIALPDADQTPEEIGGVSGNIGRTLPWARRLAEDGFQVIVPTLLDRDDTHAGAVELNRFTNQPHREWIHRQAYTLGRHPIGLDVQQVRAAVAWCAAQPEVRPIGVAGWGEGGLVALHAAALEPRVAAALVSGYFGPRERLWSEPIYRNVFGLLREFGDAELAALVAPRALVIEPARAPEIAGPPAVRAGRRATAAPGVIATPAEAEVRREVARARELAGAFGARIALVGAEEKPMGEAALRAFRRALLDERDAGASDGGPAAMMPWTSGPAGVPEAAARQKRLVQGIERELQARLARQQDEREATFWKPLAATKPEAWAAAVAPHRERFGREIVGRLPRADGPVRARSRVLGETPEWTTHEVVLDVGAELTLWGYLLVPRGLAGGERRPVVVAQHGLSGVPADLLTEDPAARATAVYRGLAAQLARRGYVVFAPHFPWRAQEDYRRLQRKAQPIGLSVFSFILAHHERLLDWLGTLPMVDAARIAFYGLSWGGKVALRVPALEPRYALSICSGDFNDWIWKNATTAWAGSYLYSPEADMFDFNLGPTFSHAEMAAMIAPRPFMVERGHDDGVGTDERVALEYARVRRLYARLGVPERTEIEFFSGGHRINAVGTFHFLQRHLNWPSVPPPP